MTTPAPGKGQELLPCPFCGGAASPNSCGTTAFCNGCDATAPLRAWNRRAAPGGAALSAPEGGLRDDGLTTPAGYRRVEAYTNDETVIVCGEPECDDPNHSCDAMGCGTLSHVIYRAIVPAWQRPLAEEGRG